MARMSSLYATAIEQDIYAMAILQYCWRQSGNRGLRRQICRIDCRFPTELFDEGFGFLVGSISLL